MVNPSMNLKKRKRSTLDQLYPRSYELDKVKTDQSYELHLFLQKLCTFGYEVTSRPRSNSHIELLVREKHEP